MKKRILLLPLLVLSASSCSVVKSLEHTLNVVYEYNGNIIYTDTCSEFKNAMTPTLSEAMIPVNHEFFGWTWLNPDTVVITEEGFESKYIEDDDVVHYHEVKEYANNSTVTLYPLFVNIDDIPIPNYYIAIGWYAKTSTSGLDEARINAWAEDLKAYLISEGATTEDINNIVIKGYEGDVATAGSLINKDRYIDVLVGFGGNIDSTGGVPIIEKASGITMGGKSRYVHRLTEKETAIKVYNWLQTEDGNKALA